MKKLLLFISVTLLHAASILAVPAKRGIITYTQPDGSIIETCLYGDEHFNYRTTSDGYLISVNDRGYLEYANMESFQIKTTGIKVSKINNRTKIETDHILKAGKFSISNSEMALARGTRMKVKELQNTMQRSANAAAKGIVILVNFSDVSFVTPNPNQAFHNLLNQEGYSANGALGSAKDYFEDMSNDSYQPVFDVFGPFTLSNNMSYYGRNDYSGNDQNPAQMIVDAMEKLMNDSSSIQLSEYDTDNDGNIDNIFVFYAGHNEAEGARANTIWPHAWVVSNWNASGNLTYQNKTISRYACTSELTGGSGSTMTGIGTFAHEFSHVLGLPDIYATNYSSHKTSGAWDIMDYGPYNNNGNTPPAYSAYEKFFMGWLTPTILNEAKSCTLANIIDHNEAYLISANGTHNLDGDDPVSSEFFLLETRNLKSWDEYLPGDGMIITKIKYDESAWYNNTVNNYEYYMGIDIIEADGIDYIGENGKPGDAFPGSASVTSYTPYSNYPITNIEFVDSVISFDFMGGDSTISNNALIDQHSLTILNNNTLVGTKCGDKIRCIDFTGKTLWTSVATDSQTSFLAPKGVYIIIVESEGVTKAIKGINR